MTKGYQGTEAHKLHLDTDTMLKLIDMKEKEGRTLSVADGVEWQVQKWDGGVNIVVILSKDRKVFEQR